MPSFVQLGSNHPQFIDLTSPTPSPTKKPEQPATKVTASSLQQTSIKPKSFNVQPADSQNPSKLSAANLALHTATFGAQSQSQPAPRALLPSVQRQANIMAESHHEKPFGSSIVKARNTPSTPNKSAPNRPVNNGSYAGYIKPATPGAFKSVNENPRSSNFAVKPSAGSSSDPPGYINGWPERLIAKPATNVFQAPVSDPQEEEGEVFNLDEAKLTAEDYQRVQGDPEKHMRRLLEGAVGDGEEDPAEDGDETVEGFSEGVKLMPHQIRGVKWMRKRETNRNRGGILADVRV